MVNIGLVEIKSKVVEKERKRPSYSSSLNSYGFMSLITIDSPKYVETDVDVVTGKIYKGRYNIDTDYAIIFLYDFYTDDASREFITLNGGRLHSFSANNITILTYFDTSMIKNWSNVQQRSKIRDDPDCDPAKALEIINELKELYEIEDNDPYIIVLKQDQDGNEQSFKVNVSDFKGDALYDVFMDIMTKINDNCEEEFNVIEGKICASRTKITMKNNMSILNTRNFVNGLIKDERKKRHIRYTQDSLAGEIGCKSRQLRNKIGDNTFTRNECLYIGVKFGITVSELNELLRENNQLDLGVSGRDGVIRMCMNNGYGIDNTNEILKERGFLILP